MNHIADAVMNAKRRGVDIRIISDRSMIATARSQINRFQTSGIDCVLTASHFKFRWHNQYYQLNSYFAGLNVRIAGTDDLYMHNKFCLIDVLTDEKKVIENTHPLNGVLINGSMNWTTNVREGNFFNVI